MNVGHFSPTSPPLLYIRTHIGEKHGVLNKCGGTFIVKSDHNEHKRIHTKENIFDCNEQECDISKSYTLWNIRILCGRDRTDKSNVGEPVLTHH